MAKIGDVLRIVDRLIPKALAREWDNPGLQVGSLEWPAKGVLLSLDPDLSMLEKAREVGANITITHHPLILDPLRRIDLDTPTGRVVEKAVREGVTVYSCHTNLDIMEGGVNDTLAERLGLLNKVSLADIGRIGDLPEEETLDAVSVRIKSGFSILNLTMVGDPGMKVRRVAVCGGSGGSLIRDASENGADLLVTGDVKYHAAREAEAYGLSIVDMGHFASEALILPVMANLIKGALEVEGIGIGVHIHRGEDPLKFA
jgi:dinuclear metal center YbgI/SA1388 family protein